MKPELQRVVDQFHLLHLPYSLPKGLNQAQA